jgi:WD40 repeat protein
VLLDGRLASGSVDGTIRLWDVARGAEDARLEGHPDAVMALCVLPDGRLASGSADRTIRLWDVALQREISCLDEVGAPDLGNDHLEPLVTSRQRETAQAMTEPTMLRLSPSAT